MRAAFFALVLVMLPWRAWPSGSSSRSSGWILAPRRRSPTWTTWAGKPHATFGASGLVVGQVFGVEGDISFSPGFFQASEQQLVLGSSVTTVTGNLIVAFPRRWTVLSPAAASSEAAAHAVCTSTMERHPHRAVVAGGDRRGRRGDEGF